MAILDSLRQRAGIGFGGRGILAGTRREINGTNGTQTIKISRGSTLLSSEPLYNPRLSVFSGGVRNVTASRFYRDVIRMRGNAPLLSCDAPVCRRCLQPWSGAVVRHNIRSETHHTAASSRRVRREVLDVRLSVHRRPARLRDARTVRKVRIDRASIRTRIPPDSTASARADRERRRPGSSACAG